MAVLRVIAASSAALVCAMVLVTVHAPARAAAQLSSGSGRSFTWKSLPVVLHLAEDSKGSAARLANAAKKAARVWSAPCSSARISIGAPLAHGVVRDDGVSTMIVRRESWCKNGDPRGTCYDPDVAAMSTISFRDLGDGAGVEIYDVDVELNGVHYAWGDQRSDRPRGASLDLERVLAHEFGHVLGFDDSCETARSRDVEAGVPVPAGRPLCAEHWDELKRDVMFPLPTSRGSQVSLSNDERAILCAAYPVRALTPRLAARRAARPR